MNLINDDCLTALKHIADKSVNLVVADLPYGQTKNDWDIKIDLAKLWEELKRVATTNCAYIFFTTKKFGIDLILSNKDWFRYDWFRYDLVYQKNKPCGFLNAKKMPMRSHEMIYIFYNKLPTYNILNFETIINAKKRHHATEKPIDLLEWIIRYYSNEGDTILDPTMGSGSTGVACVNMKRKFIGIEMDKGIFDVACKRITETQILPTSEIKPAV